MSSGKFFAHSMITKTIPSIHNDWLEENDSLYGSKQELDSGWEDNFTNAGVLKVYDHKISCLEGLKKVQYTVVNQNEDYKNGKVKAIQALFGSCMKELKGAGDPATIKEILENKMQNL